jgi:large subunit ribosomal protein L25
VNLKEKITANVPVEVEGESPAEKSGLGTAVQQLQEIEIEALPTDIPEKFVINIDNLTEVDQAIFIKDVKAPEGVEIITDGEQIVVKVEPLQKEEVIEEAPATTEEGATPEAQAPAEETPQSES